jgi:hypothetical protein
VLTVVGGKVVYAAGDFEKLGPASVPVLPDWSPVVKVPGHWRPNSPLQAQVHQCSGPARCTPTAMKKRDCRTHRSVISPVSGALRLLVLCFLTNTKKRRPDGPALPAISIHQGVSYEQCSVQTPEQRRDAVVLLVDHQTGLISLVQDFSNEFKNNVLAW